MEFIKRLIDHLFKDLDNPEPIFYSRHAPMVWAQVEKTLRVAHTEFQNVRIFIDYNEHQPPSGKPLEIHATIDISHPDLKSMRDLLPDDEQDLRSKIYLKAFIQPLEEKKCHLILRWKVEGISFVSRKKHDEIITKLTRLFDKNIKAAE